MKPELPEEQTAGKLRASPAQSPQAEPENRVESPARNSDDIPYNADILAEPRVVALDAAEEEGVPTRCEHFANASMTALALLAAFLISAVYVTLRSVSEDNMDMTIDDLDTERRGQFWRLVAEDPAIVAISSYDEPQTANSISTERNEKIYKSNDEKSDDLISMAILRSKVAAVGNDDQILPINVGTTVRSSLLWPIVQRRSRLRITRRMSRRMIYRAAFLNISQFTKPVVNIQLVVKDVPTSSTGFSRVEVARGDDYSDYSVVGGENAQNARKSQNSQSTRNRAIKHERNAQQERRGDLSNRQKNEERSAVNSAADSRERARRKRLKNWSKLYTPSKGNKRAVLFENKPTESEETAFHVAGIAAIERGTPDMRVVNEILHLVRNNQLNRSQHSNTTGFATGSPQDDGSAQHWKRGRARSARTAECDNQRCQLPYRLFPSTIDVSVDPCDDFHKHVCGSMQDRSGNPFQQMRAEALNSLKAVLESTPVAERGHAAIHKAVNLYRACVRFPTDGLAIELPRIRRFLASVGMNLAAAAKDRGKETTKNPVLRMLRLSLQYALHTFVAFLVDGIHAVNGKKMLRVLVSKNDKEWLKDRRMLSEQEMKDYYAGILLVYEAKPLSPAIVMLIPDIANFESQASRKLKAQDRISNRRQEGLFFDLEELAAYANWYQPPDEWHAELQRISLLAYGINDTAHATPAGLALLKLMTLPEQRWKVAQLMTWSLIRQLVGFGRNLLLATHSDLKDRCILKVSEVMEPALQGLFLLKPFTPRVRTRVETISRVLLNATIENFKQPSFSSRLPDNATRLEAVRRLATVDVVFGFPDHIRNESDLEATYGGFPEANGVFWETWILCSSIVQKRVLQKVVVTDVRFPVASVMAAYTPSLNKLIVPAGVARPPVFMDNAPVAYHYGTIGTVMARAIMRGASSVASPGLDDSTGGSHDWWTPVARSYYDRASKCVKSDPRSASTDYAYAESVLGETELIVEVAATTAAYEAFSGSLVLGKSNFPSALPYTAEQLFFVANCALRCCEVERLESGFMFDGDSFSEGTAPFCGPSHDCNSVMNRMPKFSAAFNCPLGSKMNPAANCTP